MATRPPPSERLDPRALTVWRLGGLLTAMPIIFVVLTVGYGIYRLDLLPGWLVLTAAIVVVLLAGLGIWPIPDLVWRQWRYEIGDADVDLQHGWWTVTRTLIPMSRIQHVDTRRGPLQRRFGLASVILFTAAGSSEIPALADEVAASTRDRIAALANVVDEL